jgi:uncharacterized membrane protein
MTQLLIATATTLHALATVVFIGYFVLLSVLILPALPKLESGTGLVLSEISKRSRAWMYGSFGIFVVTGVYLMLVDANYQGIGNFNNPWAVFMLIKHIVIVGMIGLGFWYNALQRVGPAMRANNNVAQAVEKFRQYVNVMAVCGVAVLLLTALSQAQ